MSRPSSRVAVAGFGGFLALSVAWMVTLPLFAGPDEPANFIKAAAVIRGELVGEPIAASASTSFWSTYVDIDARFGTAQQVPWCFVGQPLIAACNKPLQSLTPVENSRTDMGRYPPVGFLPAGVGTLVGPTDAGVRAARLTAAFTCAALLTIAAELLRRRNRSITPLLVATTPGVLFLSSVSSPSGVEIVAAIAAWTATWCAIDERWSRPSTVAIFVAATALLVLSRAAGVVTVGVMVLTAVISDQTAARCVLMRQWRRLLWLLTSLALSGAWYLAVYDDNFGVRLDVESRVVKFTSIVSHSFESLPRLVAESVGNFGWLDTPSPAWVVWAFVALTVALLWSAISGATMRVRLAIAVVALSGPVWLIALNQNYQHLLGTFGAQGRHLTPLLVGLPLAAVMRRTPHRSDIPIITIALVLHMSCVVVALRRYSFGAQDNDFFGFIGDAEWAPPLGMPATLAIVTLAHISAWFALRQYAGRIDV
jgi:ABC-type multidrug transport system fused ATPase/permease subunit